MSNSERERGSWCGSGEEEGYIGNFGHVLGSLGKVSQSGEDVPIDNLKSKVKENWMMETVGFQEMFTIVLGMKREKVPGPESILNDLLKYGRNRTVEVWCSLVNLVMDSRYWPDDWRRSCIVPLKLGMRWWLVNKG